MTVAALLEVRDLTVQFFLKRGNFKAVDRVSFAIDRSETFGLVGESGCGKTLTALSLLRLIPSPPARITGGDIFFEGKNILSLSSGEIRRLRGASIAMIFQEPMTSLNPLFTIGHQISAGIRLHQGVGQKSARTKTIELLERVGIPSAGERFGHYPHQFSGGMRQRAMIAMALSCHPSLLIADEPTTALDVTVQSEVLALLDRLVADRRMALIFVSHDLAVVSRMTDHAIVMRAGEAVERGSIAALLASPRHPYTAAFATSAREMEAGFTAALARGQEE